MYNFSTDFSYPRSKNQEYGLKTERDDLYDILNLGAIRTPVFLRNDKHTKNPEHITFDVSGLTSPPLSPPIKGRFCP